MFKTSIVAVRNEEEEIGGILRSKNDSDTSSRLFHCRTMTELTSLMHCALGVKCTI